MTIAATRTQPIPPPKSVAAVMSPTLPHSPDVGGRPTRENRPRIMSTVAHLSRDASPESFRKDPVPYVSFDRPHDEQQPGHRDHVMDHVEGTGPECR